MKFIREAVQDLIRRCRQLSPADLRWSFLISGLLVLLGAGVNLVLPHGWTVWPFVVIAGLLVMLNESTDRNGEGVPPLQVYALFFSALGIYVVLLAVLSALNLFVVLAGLATCIYFAVKAYLEQRLNDQVLAERLANGQCIHCGHPVDPALAYCAECGDEPDPSTAQRQRIRAIVVSNQQAERMRSVLSKKSAIADLQKKEKALMGRRPRSNTRRL